jgi:hypothetical protein
MKVYVVQAGKYSDKYIAAIFTSKEKAEMYCAIHNKPGSSAYFDEFYYDEMETSDNGMEGNVEVGLAFAIWQLDAYSVTSKSYKGFITTRNNVDDRYVFIPELNNEEALEKAFKIFCDKKAAGEYDRVDDGYYIKNSYKDHGVDYDYYQSLRYDLKRKDDKDE